jgi:hypothetical protein
MSASGDAPARSNLPLAGGCMCGSVRYEVHEPLLAALYCHCKRCQRRSGSAFSVTALTVPGSLRVTQGTEALRSWRPPDGWVKSFCAECGSHLYTTHPDNPQLLSVRMGSLDEDPGIRAQAHQFVAYAAAWEPQIDDDLPRFPERLPAGTSPSAQSSTG